MKILAKNRRASYDYTIERKIIAGIVLSGSETKSVRQGHISMKGSFAYFKNNELWLVNAHISPYSHAPQIDFEPTRARKLLISRKEIAELQQERTTGRTIVPLSFLGGRYIKVELGIGKGKKNIDKREAIKKRDTERHTKRELKTNK